MFSPYKKPGHVGLAAQGGLRPIIERIIGKRIDLPERTIQIQFALYRVASERLDAVLTEIERTAAGLPGDFSADDVAWVREHLVERFNQLIAD